MDSTCHENVSVETSELIENKQLKLYWVVFVSFLFQILHVHLAFTASTSKEVENNLMSYDF